MNVLTQRTKLGLEIAGAGVVAGITGDALLRAMPWGLNATIGTVLLVATGTWLVRRNKVTMEAVRRFTGDLHGVLMGAKLSAAAR